MPGGPRGLQNRRRYASGEIGSIPILSASLLTVAAAVSAAPRRRRACHYNLFRKEVNHVARTDPKTDVVIDLCRLSSQVEPTGPVASFAAVTSLPKSQCARELEHVR